MQDEARPKQRPQRKEFRRLVTVGFAATSVDLESVDLEIKWSAQTASVADLIHAATDELGASRFNAVTATVDGAVVPTSTALEDAHITNGSRIECGAIATIPTPTSGAALPRARYTIDHVAGCDAGGRVWVPDGAVATMRHSRAEPIQATVGTPGAATTETTWKSGDYREVGTEVVAVQAHDRTDADQAHDGTDADQRLGAGDDAEPIVVRRPPRVVAPDRTEVPDRPDLPTRPADPPPLSWASLVAPIPIGIAMAVLFRPYFLLFTAAGPVMFFGRWWEGKRRYRRACVEWQRQVYDRNVDYQHQLASAAADAAAERRRRHPTICEVLERVERVDRSLWERRPAHDDFAVVAIAYGTKEWGTGAASPGERPPSRPGVATLGNATTAPGPTLRTVPVTVDLRYHHTIGIVGDESARSLVRALICQLAVLHGPAHMRIGTRGDAAAWSWLKWLPHYFAAQDDPAAAAVTDALWSVCLVELDETSPPLAPKRDAPDDAVPTTVTNVILAATVDRLPTECSLLIDCRGFTAGSDRVPLVVTDVATGAEIHTTNLIGLNEQRAEHLARRMAHLVDPELATSAGALETTVALVDLAQWHSVRPILDAWEQNTDDALGACIGSAGEPYEIDLVQDGPHALVAGTTGSGKSELLRTWVTALAGRYAPSDCAFVLIDFKGGGAFDTVARLPHVAAVVTDLDEGLAQRGLRSLRAELRDREHRLRDRDAADIEAYRKLGLRDLPRLVLIIDEFATLAAELPAFLDGLVDIAQRGRSLGVHLVLATQRPAGVLDQKIRANTNLRICLRVQDSADSMDVIDVRDAAALPRNRPGRALIRKGADDVRVVQCAHIGPGENRPGAGLRYRRFEPGTPMTWRPDYERQPGAVDTVVAATKQGHARGLVRVPRAPWCAPLPATLRRDDLWHDAPPHAMAVPIGIEDRPDERVQNVWYWDRSAGPLLVVGGSDAERRAIFATVIDSIGRASPRTDTYVIHTEIGAMPFAVQGWPGAIAADDIESIDRVLLRCASAGPNSDPVVLLVERFDLLGAGATEADAATLREHLEHVIARSARSVSVVIAGATERSVPGRIGAFASQRLVLRLADASSYATCGLRERTMPAIDAMGAVDPRDSTAVRLAGGDDDDYGELHFPTSTALMTAPKVWAGNDTMVASMQQDELVVPVGMDLVTQGSFVARVTPDEPFMIVGERRSGRSVALAAFVAASASMPTSDTYRGCVVVAGVARAASDYARWRGPTAVWTQTDETSLAQRVEGLDAPTLIVVDDADRIEDNLGAAMLDAIRAAGHYLVLAAAGESVRSLRSWPAGLRSTRNGVVLGFGRGDAELLRTAPMRFCGIDWQPGRGIGMSQCDPTLMQFIMAPMRAD